PTSQTLMGGYVAQGWGRPPSWPQRSKRRFISLWNTWSWFHKGLNTCLVFSNIIALLPARAVGRVRPRSRRNRPADFEHRGIDMMVVRLMGRRDADAAIGNSAGCKPRAKAGVTASPGGCARPRYF